MNGRGMTWVHVPVVHHKITERQDLTDFQTWARETEADIAAGRPVRPYRPRPRPRAASGLYTAAIVKSPARTG